MSRRPASVVQADIARAARVAAQLGPEWRVEVERGVIRLVQSPPGDRRPTESPQLARGLDSAP
jgi:hypothetical protein